MASSTIASTTMLYSTVIIALIASFILSADAIRCHQCNSHLEEDCLLLRLNTPRSPTDNQYLKECEGPDNAVPFCRKMETKIEVTGEHRIIRNCGWLPDNGGSNLTCISADNEGYLQTICNCYQDACNAAPPSGAISHTTLGAAFAVVALLSAALLRRSG